MQAKVLSINISCCERCPNLLKKKILKMPGVDSVAIDTEANLVYVAGEIDDATLLTNVAKLGKPVQLLSTDKQPRNHADKKKHSHHRNEGRDREFQKEKEHKNSCCCRDQRHNSQKRVEEKEEHRCEAYVPPAIDPKVCRDFFCKTHPKGRLIVDRVPPESSAAFFGMGDLPFHGPPYGGGSYQHPGAHGGYPGAHGGWYGQQPPQFGYGRPPPRRIPQHPFIFRGSHT
ncbi:heavy metal-associated isoprenylated plant protein 9-like [Salvia miltiorrhiza]|uniref:heavy metal-associated isoprenylated plant protein 9-like n=1 Tax=Salvia miltiorrhiza TaxID=226208 RepID=UPI0025AD6AFC|nr:heavy metal-associated isoprenylated plant protein 9-like [Salvia miltiorrhiza]